MDLPTKPSNIILDHIISHFHKIGRPLYIGEISTAIGWSLEKTEQYLLYLMIEGVVDRLTPAELNAYGIPPQVDVFKLLTKIDPALGHKP